MLFQILNSLERIVLKSLIKLGGNQSACVGKSQFLLLLHSNRYRVGIFRSKLSSNFQTGNVATDPFLKVTQSFPNLQEQK